MYINNEINWINVCRKKRIYIFGAGRNGEKLFRQLQNEEGVQVVGVIDNDKYVVRKCVSGNSWFPKAYILDEYKRIRQKDDLIIISTAIPEIEKQLLEEEIYPFINHAQLDFSGIKGTSLYNEDYLSLQLDYAKVDSVLDCEFFQRYIKSTDSVAEFGMGGGLLLNKLECGKKIGIEINETAREYAKQIGIEGVPNLTELQDGSQDVIISTHALEHCLNPYEIICGLRKKLVDGGKAIFVVPHDSIRDEYVRSEDCYHLYEWNQRNLGSLFKMAGYFIREVGIREVAWPRGWRKMFSEEAKDWFEAVSVLESERIGYYSVYVVAEK